MSTITGIYAESTSIPSTSSVSAASSRRSSAGSPESTAASARRTASRAEDSKRAGAHKAAAGGRRADARAVTVDLDFGQHLAQGRTRKDPLPVRAVSTIESDAAMAPLSEAAPAHRRRRRDRGRRPRGAAAIRPRLGRRPVRGRGEHCRRRRAARGADQPSSADRPAAASPAESGRRSVRSTITGTPAPSCSRRISAAGAKLGPCHDHGTRSGSRDAEGRVDPADVAGHDDDRRHPAARPGGC